MPHSSVCLFRRLFRKMTKRTSEPPLSATPAMQQNLVGIAYINSCRLIFVISSSICLWSLQRQIQKWIPRDDHLVCTEINTREGERTLLVTLCARALAASAGGGMGKWQQYQHAEWVQQGVLPTGKMHTNTSKGSLNSGKGIPIPVTGIRNESRWG